MKYLALLLVIFSSLNANCQEKTILKYFIYSDWDRDINREAMSSLEFEFQDLVKNQNIKSIEIFNTDDQSLFEDTVIINRTNSIAHVYNYDTLGRIILKQRYSKGSEFYSDSFVYNNNLMSKIYVNEMGDKHLCKSFFYNKDNKLEMQTGCLGRGHHGNKDTLKYSYNTKGQVIERIEPNYSYSQKKYTLRYNSSNKNNEIVFNKDKTKYKNSYRPNGKISKSTRLKKGTINDSIRFEYNNLGNLIKATTYNNVKIDTLNHPELDGSFVVIPADNSWEDKLYLKYQGKLIKSIISDNKKRATEIFKFKYEFH